MMTEIVIFIFMLVVGIRSLFFADRVIDNWRHREVRRFDVVGRLVLSRHGTGFVRAIGAGFLLMAIYLALLMILAR